MTDVYRKTDGKWLIVQEHVSVPVEIDTGKPDFLVEALAAGRAPRRASALGTGAHPPAEPSQRPVGFMVLP